MVETIDSLHIYSPQPLAPDISPGTFRLLWLFSDKPLEFLPVLSGSKTF
jgi:hypothetical protein